MTLYGLTASDSEFGDLGGNDAPHFQTTTVLPSTVVQMHNQVFASLNTGVDLMCYLGSRRDGELQPDAAFHALGHIQPFGRPNAAAALNPPAAAGDFRGNFDFVPGVPTHPECHAGAKLCPAGHNKPLAPTGRLVGGEHRHGAGGAVRAGGSGGHKLSTALLPRPLAVSP